MTRLPHPLRRLRAPRELFLLAGLCALLPAQPTGAQDQALGAIRGSVYDSTAARPLEDAVVLLLGAGTHLSGTDGSFRFEGVPPGSHRLSFFHPRLDDLGLESGSWEVEVVPGEEVVSKLWIPSASTLADVLCRSEPGVLVGVLRGDGSGAGVEGSVVARWTAEGRERMSATETDEAGRFVLCGLPVGASLRVHGFFEETAGADQELRLPRTGLLSRDIPIDVDRVASIRGRVMGIDDGAPVGGATLRIEGSAGPAVSDARGRFRIDSVAPGPRILEVEHLSFGVHHDTVQVEPGAELDVTVEVPTVAFELEPIEVVGRRPLGSVMERFEARRLQGRGDFILPEVLEEREEQPLSQVIVRHSSGIRRNCGNLGACELRSRRGGRSFGGPPCKIQYYIDGVYFDLPDPNDYLDRYVRTAEVLAVEVYSGPSQVPAEFNRSMRSRCGVIVIWTRSGPS